MAFIYFPSGKRIRLARTRDQILAELQGAGPTQFVHFDAEGGLPGRSVSVDVNAMQIALVSDEPVDLDH